MALSLQEISDRLEIGDLLNRWAECVDGRDWDGLERCYAPGAALDFSALGSVKGGAVEHRAFMEMAAPHFRAMQHMLTNTLFVELRGDAARTRTLVLAPSVLDDGRVFFTGAYYHDRLQRTADGWKIAERRTELVYFHNRPADHEVPSAPRSGPT